MSVEQYSLIAHDWLNLEFIINDLTQRVVGQELHPTSSPTFGSGTITGNLAVGGDLTVTGSLDIDGKLTAGSQASPIDVTNTRQYGFELHYSGNNYDVTGIRSRAQLVTTDTSASATGGLLQAANNDGINAGVLNGALIEAIGKSSSVAATISTMRGALIGSEWGAFDTVTALKTLHVRGHSLNAAGAGSFGTGYGIYIENEAVGGDGQAYDAGIYFKGTNLSAGNKAFTYGIDFSGGTYGTTEIKLKDGGTIGSSGASVNINSSGVVAIADLTASRLVSTNGSKALSSVTDFTAWIAGTVNEIQITAGGGGAGGSLGTVIIGIVDPLIVAKGGTGTATFTDGAALVGSGTGAITALARATNGQLLIGTNAGDPAVANLTGTANQVNIANASGTITLSTPQDIHTGASPTFAGLTITGNSVFGLNSSVFQPTTDSTTFFQVLDADGGTSIFNIDTVNELVGFGKVPSGNAKIDLLHTFTGGVLNYGGFYSVTQTDAVTSITGIGSQAKSTHTSGNQSQVLGYFGGGVAESVGTVIALGGVLGQASVTSPNAPTVGIAYGISGAVMLTTGTVISAASLYAQTTTKTTGSITTNYGLLVNDVTAGATNYGIYTNAGPVRFGDVVSIESTTPYQTLWNTTHEDTDGGRESRIDFKGEQSGGELTTLARIQIQHDGAADDEKGEIILSTNDGSDTDTPTAHFKIDAAGNTYVGDGGITNYTQYSALGLQTMAGQARVMISIDLEPVLATRPAANPPGEGTEDSFSTHDFNATTDESVYFHLELPHNYAAAGTIHVHFDFFVDTAPASAQGVVWGVEYKKQSIGDNFDFTADTTTAYTTTAVTTGTPANDKKVHQSSEVSLTTTGFVAGDYILLRLFRDADGTGGTDSYTADARVVDYHIEYLSDKLGEAT